MVNIYFSIINTLNWTWNKLWNWMSKQRGMRWPGENCPLWREFCIQTWHIHLVAATGGHLIKLPHFSGLSTNTNITFYCNCQSFLHNFNAPIQLFTHQCPSESSYRPHRGSVLSTLKTTNIDRLYMSRKELGSGLASIEDSVNASILGLEEYIKRVKKNLL